MEKRTMMGILIVCLLLSSCNNSQKEKTTENAVRVQTETVKTDENISDREYVGVVEEKSATSVSFGSSGTLTRVCVSAGQRVHKGQLIAELDKTQAQNMLSAAQAMMMQAKDAEERMRQLHDNNSLPDMKWVETKSNVQQAKAQLDMARKSMADCCLYAPVSGIIGKDVSSVGETALPAMPIAKILDISSVKVKVSIPEKEIVGISANTKTRITLEALGDLAFDGGVVEKCVEANGITHTYDIKVNVGNPQAQLLPGMVCKVKILPDDISNEYDRIAVPITAVQKNAQNKHFVWKVQNGHATRQIVSVGKAYGNRITILDGIKEGDVIVVKGYQKLNEGSLIKN